MTKFTKEWDAEQRAKFGGKAPSGRFAASVGPSKGNRATLPYPPSVNELYATVHGRRVLSKKGRDYHRQAGACANVQGIQPTLFPVALTVHLFRPRKAGDLDNYLKSLQDALKGVAWLDDSQVVEIHAFRHDDKDNPRVEIEILEV